MDKKTWLYIEPYCFVFENSNETLIFNSLSSAKINRMKGAERLDRIIKKLLISKNMYCTELTSEDIENEDVKLFIEELKSDYSGDIVSLPADKGKPIVMFPKLKLQRQVDVIKNISEIPIGTDNLTYLSEISIYINGYCEQSCSHCDYLYKQNEFCTKSKSELNIQAIKSLLNQIKGTAVNTINILGGDIFSYSQFDKLFCELGNIKNCNVNYHVHYKNLNKTFEKTINLKSDNSMFHLKVNLPFEYTEIKNVHDFLNKNKINHNWAFHITSVEDYNFCVEQVEKIGINNFDVLPIFTGRNSSFFKENIFLNKEDLMEITSNRNEVFAKSVININNFGKLTWRTDGKVYSNLNKKEIGTIDDSLYDLVNNELINKSAWFDIRDKEPCNNCVFKLLCPSLSNYEYVIGENNLCNLSTKN